MNRRDTIIIAVLLNASLLAILFVMAINNDEDPSSNPSQVAESLVDVTNNNNGNIHEIAITPSFENNNTQQSVDEIDNALKQFGNNPQMIVVEDDFADAVDKEPNPATTPTSLPPAVTTTPPQNPEPPKNTPPASVVDVTVKKGDALEKIARSNGTTVEAIKKANNLKNSKLNIGQVLKVPVGTKTATTTNAAAAKPVEKKETKNVAAGEEEYYTIKNGDNPWKIAKQYNVKFDDLLKLNGLNEEKARNLKPGDQIRVK